MFPPVQETIRVEGEADSASRAASAKEAVVAHADARVVPDALSTVVPLFPVTSPNHAIGTGLGSAVFSKGDFPLSSI
ncbi:hypothetical protein JIR001_19540 [Polycladomyces abyssicola]|uniref:Uncharacterized protein n=1 Tax=Polycladomyces abyssicola TaxID=1125966 RepID=A0A8D5ZPA2_9BACL|nr:hypothetical protein JIR001_19540 [Polycladomyces abyssicola]